MILFIIVEEYFYIFIQILINFIILFCIFSFRMLIIFLFIIPEIFLIHFI
jgi:hypothetical protein